MGLFGRKKATTTPQNKAELLKLENARVEIIANKQASDEMFEKTREASKHLNDVLVENGFTIKIFIAAGGKAPREKV